MGNLLCKLFCFAFFSFNFLLSQNLTNLEVIDSLINSVVDEISAQVRLERVKVQSNIQEKLIENRILNAFAKKFGVFLDDNADASKDIIRLDAFGSKIYYVVESRGFFKRSRLRRNIRINVYCLVVEGSRVILSGDFKREFADYIDPNEVKMLEDENFKFTRGEFVGDTSSLQKFLEGFIVASSIGLAIYLLFVLRK